MTLYPPKPELSESDKRLLVLLARLLLEHMDSNMGESNLPQGMLALTDEEANELLDNLEILVNSKEFTEACYFVEGMSIPGTQEEGRLREIYLSSRKRRGRTRAMASRHWSEFQQRLGLPKSVVWGTSAIPMSYEYFQKMEMQLLSAAHLHPRIIELIMRVVGDQVHNVEEIRRGQKSLEHGTVKPLVADPFFRWRDGSLESRGLEISANRIAATITIVANISVLFTTRDWSVAGTLSTMTGALVAIGND